MKNKVLFLGLLVLFAFGVMFLSCNTTSGLDQDRITITFDIGWNGTHQGENVRPGAYVFLFRSNNRGVIWEKVGTVTVVD